MLDNEIIAALIATVYAEATTAGLPATLVVKQANQPTQQGAPTAPAVFISKISHKRYGWGGVQNRFDATLSQQVQETNQYYETLYQFSALVTQDPADVTALTASDVLDAVAGIFNGDTGRAALRAAGMGVLRVTDVRNPYFIDDKGHFAASPSFDLVVTHRSVKVSAVDAVTTIEINLGHV